MFMDQILTAIELAVDERHEMEARRGAEARELFILCHSIERPEKHGFEYEIHLIEPRAWRCVAMRYTWGQMNQLVWDLTPIARRRLMEQARPCALHPQPPASADAA